MDFFGYQDKARRNTRYLLLLYLAAVASIIIMTNLLLAFVVNFGDSNAMATGGYYYSWELFGVVSLAVLLVVGAGTLYRIVSLSGGGASVAEMLDGELLVDAGGDPAKRRLLNVVEEMAIASGTPVPPVYLIPDPAINAFAAGYASGDAVIGVTEGALRQLTRDELQGVVAHEFSHILNGDMRLNIRLMGVLFGILMLAVIGRIVLEGGRGRSLSSRRNEGAGAVLAIGLGLVVLGYLGKFFGSLIKAAVSRQREYLADASAVQFTRHRSGIAGALKRIGGYETGSVLRHPESEEISHAFFSEGVRFSFSQLLSTHPPLEERIRRIEPDWDGDYASRSSDSQDDTETRRQPAGAAGLAAGFAAKVAIDPERMLSELGAPGEPELARARDLLAAIPAPLAAAAHEPYSARALVYLILLDNDAEVRRHQLESLQQTADPAVFRVLVELLRVQPEVPPQLRLPLLEMAMPALRQLTRAQYQLVMSNVDALIRADNKIGLSEWALQKFIAKHLGEAFDRGGRGRLGMGAGSRHFKAVRSQVSCLLSMLARSDASSSMAPAQAFEQGRAQLDMDLNLELLPPEAVTLATLNASVDALAQLRPLLKPRLLKACIATIVADGVATPVEVELVRTIADALDCPLPPLGI